MGLNQQPAGSANHASMLPHRDQPWYAAYMEGCLSMTVRESTAGFTKPRGRFLRRPARKHPQSAVPRSSRSLKSREVHRWR